MAGYDLINKGDSVLIGLSGGADSVCLTHALYMLSADLGIKLYTAHINHGIRGAEAARDEEFAKSFSKSLGIECFTMKADVPAVAKENGISEETAGRQIRYEFFKNLCKEHGIDKIATAHNKNDNAETLVMNFMRGSSIKGLCGIPYKRENIIRPVLSLDRAQIEEYCRQNNLEYMTDSTNGSLLYTRNKIRHSLIPLIEKEFNSNFINTVTDNAALIGEDNEYIEKQTNEAYKSIVSDNTADIDSLKKLDKTLQRRIILRMIQHARASHEDIRSVYVNDVLDLLTKNSGASVNLSDNIVARIQYGNLIIEHKRDETEPFEYTVKRNSSGFIPEISMKITISDTDKRQKDGALYLSCDTDIIVVRNRREGDVFYPYGMDGSKKVKEYFINEKIPREKRNAVPIIEIDGQIAAVGERADRRFLFKDKGIRIEFKPLEAKD